MRSFTPRLHPTERASLPPTIISQVCPTLPFSDLAPDPKNNRSSSPRIALTNLRRADKLRFLLPGENFGGTDSRYITRWESPGSAQGHYASRHRAKNFSAPG